MNEQVIMKLISAINDDPIGLDWPDDEKEQVVFSRWAIDELIGLIWDHPWTPASETIELFALKMEVFTASSEDESQRKIFKIAAEIAWETLDYLKEDLM